jgi:hypothetical protein
MNKIVDNMPIETYHAAEGISNSGLSLIKDCPARYYEEYLSGKTREQTDSMRLGDIVHTLVFEPTLLFDKYTLIPDDMNIKRNSNEGKANYAKLELLGLPFMKNEEYLEAIKVADAVRKTKITEKITFGELIDRGGHIETSIFWENEDGILLKTRPDFFNENIIIDLKTTVSAKQYDFACSIGKYGYHRQAYLQMQGLEKVTGRKYKHFINLVVEKKSPYLTAAYRLDEASLEKGREEVLEAIQTYKICKENNIWPGYQTAGVQEISLQHWYRG